MLRGIMCVVDRDVNNPLSRHIIGLQKSLLNNLVILLACHVKAERWTVVVPFCKSWDI